MVCSGISEEKALVFCKKCPVDNDTDSDQQLMKNCSMFLVMIEVNSFLSIPIKL